VDTPLLRTHRSERVCVVHLTGIGDVVHGLPIANDLKRDDPTRTVVWIAEPAPAEVLRHHPAVDEIVVFRKRRGLAGAMELRDRLAPRPCDLTLNMQRYFKSVPPTVFSGAPVRIGLDPAKTRDGISWLHTHHLPAGPWRHTQDLLLGFREPLGIAVDGPVEWKITFSPAEEAERTAFFASLPDRPVVGVVLATANPRKDWPADRYPALVERLEDLGYTVLLVGGPSPTERSAADRVLAEARRPPVDGLGDSVRRMMWMVGGADLLICPDTGPLHVAHALGTPVVGLFGHTNPARVGPWKRFRELSVDRYTEPGEEPDPSRYEPRSRRMETIQVEDVMDRVEAARQIHGVRPEKRPW
jgi:heptosyltransferase I